MTLSDTLIQSIQLMCDQSIPLLDIVPDGDYYSKYNDIIPSELKTFLEENKYDKDKLNELGTFLKRNLHNELFTFIVERTCSGLYEQINTDNDNYAGTIFINAQIKHVNVLNHKNSIDPQKLGRYLLINANNPEAIKDVAGYLMNDEDLLLNYFTNR